jgi:hypothetical protein
LPPIYQETGDDWATKPVTFAVSSVSAAVEILG